MIPHSPGLGYIAGFVDGEGSIDVHRGKPRVRVVNTFKPFLDYARNTFGGAVYARKVVPGRRPTYSWELNGREAVAFLGLIKAHLWEKREQAALALRIPNMVDLGDRERALVELSAMKRRVS
jgi:hypothetical protein